MSLLFDGRVDLGRFVLDASLEASPGETIALIGPNGSGKSTLLGAVAGLQPLTAGQLRLDGRVLDDPARAVLVAPESRGLGVVFQDLLLFPHLSVLDNVAYGLRRRGASAALARERSGEWLTRFDLDTLAHARPHSLSGGQAQRVALARALATQPHVLLLDEPLSALDAATRLEIRCHLHNALARFDGVTLVVSHDIVDVLVLADRVVELADGRVANVTTPDEFFRRPRTAYAAALVGTNLLRGRVNGSMIEVGSGVLIPRGLEGHEGELDVVIPPSGVHITALNGSCPPGSWQAPIAGIETAGDQIRAHIGGPAALTATLDLSVLQRLELAPGVMVRVTIDPSAIHVHPRVVQPDRRSTG